MVRVSAWPGLWYGEVSLAGVVLLDCLSHSAVDFADFHAGVKARDAQMGRSLNVFPVRFQFVAVAKLVE